MRIPLKQINLKKTRRLLSAFPWWFGENVFLGFLVLFFLALILSSAVFYKYVYGVRTADIQNDIINTNFKNSTFQDLLNILETRKEQFEQVNPADYRDAFSQIQELTEE